MPAAPFEIDDAKSFDENTAEFIRSLIAADPLLAELLERELPRLLRGEIQVSELWDELSHVAEGAEERAAGCFTRSRSRAFEVLITRATPS